MAERKKDVKAVTPLDVRSVTLEDLRRRAKSLMNPLGSGVTAPSVSGALTSLKNQFGSGITTPSISGSLTSPNTFSSATASPSSVSVISAADLGRLIRTARQAMRLSQQQFADLAGVGRRFVSELENGKTTLEFGLVLQVCRAAGIDINAKRRQNR